MHDYTARILYEDRLKELRREADEMRLGAETHRARSTSYAAPIRRWLGDMRAWISTWPRGDSLAHGLRRSLGPAADPRFGEDA
jgi:hypothetical protein